MPVAAYDDIANWYEDWVHETSQGDPIGVGHALDELLGNGQGTCLEVACGTGFHAGRIHRMGWTPVGVDLSMNMLRHARHRLPAARADAARLPIVDSSVPAVVSVMAHTDLPAYEPVLREAARVLRPGGVFVHIGVQVVDRPGRAEPGRSNSSPAARIARRVRQGRPHLRTLPRRRRANTDRVRRAR